MTTPRYDDLGPNNDTTRVIGVIELALIVFGIMAMASSFLMNSEDVAGKFFAIVSGVLCFVAVLARAAWLRHRS